MPKRKQIAETPMELAAILTKLEGGKSQIKIGDMRQAMKMMITLETALQVAGYKSAMMLLRRKAVQQAKAIKEKKKK